MDREKVLMPVEGFDGYFVSDSGEAFSSRPRNGKGSMAGPLRQIRLSPCSGGSYFQFGADRKKVLIHVAVARAFHGPAPSGTEVSHKDGNSHNNRASNLEYLTHRENEAKKVEHGTSGRGARNSMAKLSPADIRSILQQLKDGPKGTATKLARHFGVSISAISMIRNGHRWASAEV